MYGTIMVYTCCYKSVQTHRTCNIETNVTSELPVINTYQCKFISCYKCAAGEGVLITGEAMHV